MKINTREQVLWNGDVEITGNIHLTATCVIEKEFATKGIIQETKAEIEGRLRRKAYENIVERRHQLYELIYFVSLRARPGDDVEQLLKPLREVINSAL